MVKSIANISSEKEEMLAVVAFGCNRKAYDDLKEMFERRFDGISFFFYEYFVTDPLRHDKPNNTALSAPFLERILRESAFVPDKVTAFDPDYSKTRWMPKSHQTLEKFLDKPVRLTNFQHGTTLGWPLYQAWVSPENRSRQDRDGRNSSSIQHFLNENWKGDLREQIYSMGWFGIDFLGKKKADAKGDGYLHTIDGDKRISPEDKVALLKEFLIVIYPWLDGSAHARISFLAVPIASNSLFYGYLLLFSQIANNGVMAKHTRGDSEMLNSVFSISREIYLPVLALFENYWMERLLDETLSGVTERYKQNEWRDRTRSIFSKNKRLSFVLRKNEDRKWSNDNLLPCEYQSAYLDQAYLKQKPKGFPFESKLAWLWNQRRTFVRSCEAPLKTLKESLIFAKYLIASPGVIDEIRKAMDLHLQKVGESLPSVLIVGGPGSGKDKMAKIVRLFSERYNFGEEFVVNMAALRPSEIVPGLIAGTTVSVGFAGDKKGKGRYELEGVIEQVAKTSPKAKNYKHTIVLDELNSLDVESQGVLLRILENCDLTPIGDLQTRVEKEEVDLLIVGLMNEDPEILTRQEVIEWVKNKAMLGGLLGDVLYEFFRRLRRLREDLYFRIKRGGKIEMPRLKDRRADIPILFYFFVKENFRLNKDPFQSFRIDFGAYDSLMDRRLNWFGNIRQLQTVATAAMNKARQDDALGTNGRVLQIRSWHVKSVLREEEKIVVEGG